MSELLYYGERLDNNKIVKGALVDNSSNTYIRTKYAYYPVDPFTVMLADNIDNAADNISVLLEEKQ